MAANPRMFIFAPGPSSCTGTCFPTSALNPWVPMRSNGRPVSVPYYQFIQPISISPIITRSTSLNFRWTWLMASPEAFSRDEPAE